MSTAVLTLLLAPVYAGMLGMEAYGLIGIYTALQGLFALFDLGLGTALNRELAAGATRGSTSDRATAIRTYEVVYLAIGLTVGLSLGVSAPWLESSWVNVQGLSPETVTSAFMLMALLFALQWPTSLYSGGLLGLEKHVVVNVLQIVFAVLRGVGAVAVLLVTPSVLAFFAWNAVVAGGQTLSFRIALARAAGPGASGRFRLSALTYGWRFALGMTGITVTAAVLMQLDKLLLAKLLPLEAFGSYALAATAASGLYYLASPVFTVTFPALTRLIHGAPDAQVAGLYHLMSQTMVVAVIPAAMLLVVFPRDVLLAWTGDPLLALRMRDVLALLAAGTAVNALMMVPYALQLAQGWTALALWSNVAAIAMLVPLLVFATTTWGAPGAAASWLMLNVAYLTVQPILLHRRYLPGHRGAWFVSDLLRPGVSVALVAAALRFGLPVAESRAGSVLLIFTCATVFVATAVLAAPAVRVGAWRRLRSGRQAIGWL